MKYMGSKARIAKEILPIILVNRKPGQYYVEPFAGGMNSISIVDGPRIANDINEYLIEMWKELVEGWVPKKVAKEEYISIREFREKYPPHLVGWVGFNCSYSGKWFGGFAGETKTKTGGVRDYQNEAIKNTLKQVEGMKGVILSNRSYHELELPLNSIVYCDPPYKGTTNYSNSFDHNLFWDWVRSVAKNSHTVFVSEYDAPDDFRCVWSKEVKSSLSANGKFGASKTSIEKLFILENF